MAQTFEPVARTVLTGTASSISFTGLSGLTYTDYEIHLLTHSTDNRSVIYLNFNGNSSNIYNFQYFQAVGSTVYVGNGINQSSARIGLSAQANLAPSFAVININNQATADYRSYTAIFGSTWANSQTGQFSTGNYSGTWRSTNAITQITLTHNFNANTVATLYGIRAS